MTTYFIFLPGESHAQRSLGGATGVAEGVRLSD